MAYANESGIRLAELSSIIWNKSENNEKAEDKDYGLTNSIRHVMGQALITFFTDAVVAKFVGDKHELKKDGITDGTMIKKTTEKEVIDTFVDLVNNEWGRKLGNTLKKEHSKSRTNNWTTEEAAALLNSFAEYFDKSWENVSIEKFDLKNGDDRKAIESFKSYLNAVEKLIKTQKEKDEKKKN